MAGWRYTKAVSGNAVAVRRVVDVIGYTVPRITPEARLALAVIEQALKDTRNANDREAALRDIERGGLEWWLGVIGVDVDYFALVCKQGGFDFLGSVEVAA